MPLSGLFAGMGEPRLAELLRHVSLGKLRTYQLFERLKTRAHLSKLNQESLRKAAPKLFARLQSGDEELATDLSQCVLVSHMDMIVAVLDHLGVPHTDGFFEKDAALAGHLSGDWQQRSWNAFQDKYPPSVLVFYLNHLAQEIEGSPALFQPAAAAAPQA